MNNTGFIRKNALALSASLGIVLAPLGVSSCAVTPTPPPPPAPAAFEAVGDVNPLGTYKVARFRDAASGQEYLIVTPTGYNGISVVAVPR